jgi:hypothetical protein
VSAGLVKCLGFSERSLTLYPLLASLLTVLLVFRLGIYWLDRRGAFYAALLFAVFPLDIIFSTRIYEDAPLNFFCTLSVLLFVASRGAGSRRRRFVFNFLAGLAIGGAYLHKVSAVYFCLLFALVGLVEMVRSRRLLWRYAFLGFGFLAVFVLDLWFNQTVNGDPFFHLHYYTTQAEILTAQKGNFLEPTGGPSGALRRLFWSFPVGSLISLYLGFFYWFIFPAFFYCLLRRGRELGFVLFWWALLAVLVNLSALQGARLPFYARGTYLMSVPGVILVAQLLLDMKQWAFLGSVRWRKGILATLAFVACLGLIATGAVVLYREPVVEMVARVFLLKSSFLDRKSLETVIGFYTRNLMFLAGSVTIFVGLIAGIAWIREEGGNRIWPAELLPVLALGFLAISSIAFSVICTRPGPRLEKEAFRVLSSLPPKTTYVDPRMKKFFDFYSAYRETARFVDFLDVRLDAIRDAYVVDHALYRSFMTQLHEPFSKYSKFTRYPDIAAIVEPDWKIVGKLHGGDVIIYDIP